MEESSNDGGNANNDNLNEINRTPPVLVTTAEQRDHSVGDNNNRNSQNFSTITTNTLSDADLVSLDVGHLS